MKDIQLTIKSNTQISGGIYEMILHSDSMDTSLYAPGQFINIRLEGFYLRRPVSICDWTEDSLKIIYKTVGAGTEAMSRYSPGKKLQVLSPLGNGFDTKPSGSTPLLIGGGVGAPPMYGLCKALVNEGRRPSVILGFNTGDDVFYVEEFKELTENLTVTTIDGSYGVKGFFTGAPLVDKPSYIYACGPEAMLRAIDEKMDGSISGQLSFEERMGCGFGVCMGCSCRTKYGSKRICKDGPVLKREEIVW